MAGSWRIIGDANVEDKAGSGIGHINPDYLNQLKILKEDSSTIPAGENYRAYQYTLIQNAISSMMELEAGDKFHIDEDTGRTASDLVALISNNYKLAAPKIFPHDEEVLALTWLKDNIKTLLTIEGSDADILNVNLINREQTSVPLSENDQFDLKKLVKILAGSEKAATK
ncbi:hypothetical protein CQ052_05095 [Ochrobactrum sp. MYb15]|nr:hypothetical protein CQZ90_03795 [Ochrobactrum sp. MYb19]PRA62605.1 hypothetical protein CQ053_17180 [Ochrobactrum sp. MYb18]PRA76741.1 hypothetical protein CQ049_05095 [Brucella thiophenivorans]PRA93625.1 hypothetical protein CQ051_03795 [Ochrobactrum sp. MYb14]PRA98748.1 hypothetical protein CQ052_05095 [Ochrobactrum sp. MYb15]